MIIDATQAIMTILDGANFTIVLKKFKKPINKKGTLAKGNIKLWKLNCCECGQYII
jgi:hypothetical protein